MPLKYYEKWVSTRQEDRHIACIDFSPCGKYVAYGSREALTIVTLDNGELRCRVLGSSTITALSWLPIGGNTLVCTYRTGIIANFTIDKVSLRYVLTCAGVAYSIRITMSMHNWHSFPNTRSPISQSMRTSPDWLQVEVMTSGFGTGIKKVFFKIVSSRGTWTMTIIIIQGGTQTVNCLGRDLLVIIRMSMLWSPPSTGVVYQATKMAP